MDEGTLDVYIKKINQHVCENYRGIMVTQLLADYMAGYWGISEGGQGV